MSIVDVQYRTVTCNAPNCPHTITYENPTGANAALEANPWLKTVRLVQTADQRVFSYCSDLCEIAGIETGLHNIQEKPKVEIPQGSAQAQIAAAAVAAKRSENASKAIKDGQPITIK